MNNNLKKQVEVQGMKKLDSVKGVQALDAKELKEVEGGIWGELLIGVVIAAAVEVMGDWENFKAGLKGELYRS